jgi:hypothetical protein
MEAVSSFGTFVTADKILRCHNQENLTPNCHYRTQISEK